MAALRHAHDDWVTQERNLATKNQAASAQMGET